MALKNLVFADLVSFPPISPTKVQSMWTSLRIGFRSILRWSNTLPRPRAQRRHQQTIWELCKIVCLHRSFGRQHGVSNPRLPNAGIWSVLNIYRFLAGVCLHCGKSLIAATGNSICHRTNGSYRLVIAKRRGSFAHLPCQLKTCTFGTAESSRRQPMAFVHQWLETPCYRSLNDFPV